MLAWAEHVKGRNMDCLVLSCVFGLGVLLSCVFQLGVLLSCVFQLGVLLSCVFQLGVLLCLYCYLENCPRDTSCQCAWWVS